MKRACKRLLTMLLAVSMVFGLSGMTAFGAEAEGGTPVPLADTEEYNVKYAVCIWGIDQDVDESGHTLGLTFGPATGADYRDTYEAHLSKAEYEAGGICLHWMSWEEIATQSRIDPTVFQDCLESGCTHSVNLMLNNDVLDTSYAGMMEGDGAGALHYSVQERRCYWNVQDTNAGGYPASQVRAVLVGRDSFSKSETTNMLDDYNCLYSCFPVELQEAIVAKEVKSFSYYDMQEEDRQNVYDKLWLFSGVEMYGRSGESTDAVIRSLEGELYQRSELLGITTDYYEHDALFNYDESGQKCAWWTRTMSQSYVTQAYVVLPTAVPIAYQTNHEDVALAPGFCLAGPADRTELRALIATAEGLDKDDYTPGSWAALTEALDAARAVLDKADATQKEVDDAVLDLQDAIDSLQTPADKAGLEETIAEAEALDESVYTPNSWAVLEAALDAARAVRDDEDASQTEVDTAREALEDAIGSLIIRSDRAELEEVIAEAEALDESDYTPTSWAALTEALAAARDVDADANALEDAVRGAADDLVAAIANLEKVNGQTVDKAALLDAYLEGRGLDESDYRASTWGAFADALDAAREVLLSQDASQEGVQAALTALQNARADLIKLADKIELEAVIEAAEELDEDRYTPTSWAALADALDAARAVDADPDASQEEADAVLDVLQSALDGLVERADKTELEETIAATENLDESSFTAESWTALEAALAAARDVDADGDAEQSVVDAAALSVVAAVAGLQYADGQTGVTADKEALLDVYREAITLSEDDYSVESWAAIEAALAGAWNALLDVSASQDEVDAALEKLVDAMDNLDVPFKRAFAIYSAADDSLTFYGDYSNFIPGDGGSYNGKEATTVYRDVNRIEAISTSGIPWYGLRDTVTSVVIDDSFAEMQPISLAFWFRDYAYASFSGFENIDTSNVTSLRSTFEGCSSLTDVDLSGWDTSRVTNMSSVFYDCPSLESTGSLAGWNTANVTTLYGMFYNCSSLTELDVSGWNTRNVTTMQYMFRDCSSLTDLEGLAGWNTANVTILQQLFYNCTSLNDVDVADWNTANVTNMGSTFRNCASFTSIDISGWDTTGVENNGSFATGCSNLEWVKIGAKTTIFTLGQCVSQQNWYDSPIEGNLVSSKYLTDVNEPGQYWTYTGSPEPTISGIKITSTLAGDSKTYDGTGATLTVTATVDPEGAALSWQWYKDGAAIDGATKDSLTIDGKVSDSGTYQCVVTATNEGLTAEGSGEITITINAAAQAISYAETAVSKKVGDAAFTNPLTETTLSKETGAGITYKSSNTSVATVDSDGKVTILAEGTATITATAAATANYKEAAASYTLTVAKADDSGTGGNGGNGGNTKNGLYMIEKGKLWGYYVNGNVDTSYTGFAENDNGKWYVVNGYIRFNQNTVAKDTTGVLGTKGTWYYVIGNKVQESFTGLADYSNANGWWYIVKGKVDFSHNGVDKNKNGWFYVTGGKVQFGFTGLANYSNANGWWYIVKGKVDFSHNGVDKNKNGWYYVTSGKVQFGFTGLAHYKNQNGWWYITNGKVNFKYNGIASNQNGTWYLAGGKVQLNYNGTVTSGGRTYNVHNGRVR